MVKAIGKGRYCHAESLSLSSWWWGWWPLCGGGAVVVVVDGGAIVIVIGGGSLWLVVRAVMVVVLVAHGVVDILDSGSGDVAIKSWDFAKISGML